MDGALLEWSVALDITIPAETIAELEQVSRLPDEYLATFIDIFQKILRGGQSLSRPAGDPSGSK